MEKTVHGRRIRLLHGDITHIHVDAIVNAANQHLVGGGGVDGAIHRAGGPEIMEACRRAGGCPTGKAIATTAGRLPAKYVIHAVAPRWSGGTKGEADLLRSAYRSSLTVADELGVKSLAFPSLGTGAYGYPIDQAASIALSAVHSHLQGETSLNDVVFVLFSEDDLRTYERILGNSNTDPGTRI